MAKYTNLPKSVLDTSLPFGGGSDARKNQLEPDYEANFTAWQADDTPKTRGALLRSVQPVVDTAVFSYAGKGASPAVRSQAKLMAMDAFKSYDPAKGNMKTHLLSTLRRLHRTAAQGQQIIRQPEKVALDRKHLREAEEALRDNLGRDPSDMEIANHTGLSIKRIGYVRNAKPPANSGSILDGAGETYSPPSTIPGDTSREDAWQEMVYYDLGEIDQAVMDYTLGLHGAPSLTNREIANRLGVTPAAVSHRARKIQMMMDEQYQVDPFGGSDA